LSDAVGFRASYRLQLGPDLDFAETRALIPYLRDLGVSHLYLSPSLQARAGSTHGYDVVDPTRVSADLGGEAELRRLAEDAHNAGMGIILDLVPNHMAVDEANPFWADPELRAWFFDIDPVTGEHRRFFDIDDLAGVRVEDEEVFERTHELVLSMVRDGVIDGVRIDHPDGLADPAQYLRRLRERGVERIWVEKILESGERLRDWPVAGTVGYEFLNQVCAVFVDPDAEPAFDALWREASGDARGFAEVALGAKLEQARETFAREVRRLGRLIDGLVDDDGLARAVAAFPVYRTYVRAAENEVVDEDRAVLAQVDMPPPLTETLLLERPAAPEFVTRFQQTTPPVVAKGVEDTAFYRYARLVALCEVGGDPGRFGLAVGAFHDACAERARRFPLTMLTTMTHDTKRSADVRARIAALTLLPDRWTEHVRRWFSLTDELRSERGAPDDVERYFMFQTLAGAWPIARDRFEAYMQKALREAKRNTSWVEPDGGWEEDVAGFCRRLFEHRPFLEDFRPFAAELAVVGDRVALGMVALKLTAPGIPDIYQGDELPLLALVDPDNRRPVDWRWRQAMFSRLGGGSPPDPQTRKLWLTMRLLQLRIRRPQAFVGSYLPLEAGERTVAYLRGGEVLVAVAVRPDVGGDELRGAQGIWRDVLAGEQRSLGSAVAVSELVDDSGIAILELAHQ
jgi:(1->4)-alpha-D-glucan 1-alpha-D-glucosylmutase